MTELRAPFGIKDVLEPVSNHYNVSRDDIMKNRYSEERKVAIYLMKERTGATNREIGEAFSGLSEAPRPKVEALSRHSRNSAVSKVYQRFKKEIYGTGNSGVKLQQLKRLCPLSGADPRFSLENSIFSPNLPANMYHVQT